MAVDDVVFLIPIVVIAYVVVLSRIQGRIEDALREKFPRDHDKFENLAKKHPHAFLANLEKLKITDKTINVEIRKYKQIIFTLILFPFLVYFIYFYQLNMLWLGLIFIFWVLIFFIHESV